MPNHISHRMTIEGPKEVLDEICLYHLDNKHGLNAQSLIPIPMLFEQTTSPSPLNHLSVDEQQDAMARLPTPGSYSANETDPLPSDWIENLRALQKYGIDNWYDWTTTHWGTEGGFYNGNCKRISDTGVFVTFDSAWSPSPPLMEKLAELYPEITAEVDYLDEGLGFGGTFYLAEGDAVNEELPSDMGRLKLFASEYFGWKFEEETNDE